MKKIAIGCIVLWMVVLSSCMEEEGYSLGDFWIDLGILEMEGNGSYTVTLDDGTVLFPIAGHDRCLTLDDRERVMVDYTILDEKVVTDSRKEYYVRINSLTRILKKGILDITPANEDSIGSDAIVVKDAWVSRNQLLNFKLGYYGNTKIHYINLVKLPGELTAGDQPILLELRHNRNKDREVYPMTAFVSFELDSIRIAGIDSVRFEVRSVDYEGDTDVFKGVYHY